MCRCMCVGCRKGGKGNEVSEHVCSKKQSEQRRCTVTCTSTNLSSRSRPWRPKPATRRGMRVRGRAEGCGRSPQREPREEARLRPRRSAARRSRGKQQQDLFEHEHGSARATATRGKQRSCRERWRAGSGTTRRRVLEMIQSGGEVRGTTATTATTQQNSELVGAPRTRRWHGSSDDSGDRIAMEKSRIGFGYT